MDAEQAEIMLEALERLEFLSHVVALAGCFIGGGLSLAVIFYALGRRNIIALLLCVCSVGVASAEYPERYRESVVEFSHPSVGAFTMEWGPAPGSFAAYADEGFLAVPAEWYQVLIYPTGADDWEVMYGDPLSPPGFIGWASGSNPFPEGFWASAFGWTMLGGNVPEEWINGPLEELPPIPPASSEQAQEMLGRVERVEFLSHVGTFGLCFCAGAVSLGFIGYALTRRNIMALAVSLTLVGSSASAALPSGYQDSVVEWTDGFSTWEMVWYDEMPEGAYYGEPGFMAVTDFGEFVLRNVGTEEEPFWSAFNNLLGGDWDLGDVNPFDYDWDQELGLNISGGQVPSSWVVPGLSSFGLSLPDIGIDVLEVVTALFAAVCAAIVPIFLGFVAFDSLRAALRWFNAVGGEQQVFWKEGQSLDDAVFGEYDHDTNTRQG